MQFNIFFFFFVVCIAPSFQFASSRIVQPKSIVGDLSLRHLPNNHAITQGPTSSLASTSAHWMPVKDVLSNLDTSEENGLLNAQLDERYRKFGWNTLAEPPKNSIIRLVIEQFNDRMVQGLLVVAGFSAFHAYYESNKAQGFIEPLAILSILVINALVGVLQSMKAESSLEHLKKLQPSKCTVLRNQKWEGNFDTTKLFPGDILYLKIGDKVPADARILKLKGNALFVDESCLTGESVSVSKSTEPVEITSPLALKTNMLFSGTLISSGSCYAVVTATGVGTEIGMIQAGVQDATTQHGMKKTPLEESLHHFSNSLGAVVLGICASVWVLSYPKFGHTMFPNRYVGALHYLKSAIALGVAAIPEGLPTAITLCLALGTKRLAGKNVIVRKLSSVETLGCTTVICTDKTGTLTTNQMTVKALLTFQQPSFPSSKQEMEVYEEDEENEHENTKNAKNENARNENQKNQNDQPKNAKTISRKSSAIPSFLQERSVQGVNYHPVGKITHYPPSSTPSSTTTSSTTSSTFSLLSTICTLCNDARLHLSADGSRVEYSGEPTEAALKVLVEKLGLPPTTTTTTTATATQSLTQQQLTQCQDYWSSLYTPLATLEFTRDRKSMSVLVQQKKHSLTTSSPVTLTSPLTSPSTSPSTSTSSATLTSTSSSLLSRATPTNILLVKGAAELLLSRCSRIQYESGHITSITPDMRHTLLTHLTTMSTRPLRCLAMAYKPHEELPLALQTIHTAEEAVHCPILQNSTNYALIEQDLVLVGITGLTDPARPEAVEAMEKCRGAGIRVMMMTGDSRDTAVAIAKEVKIFTEEEMREIEEGEIQVEERGKNEEKEENENEKNENEKNFKKFNKNFKNCFSSSSVFTSQEFFSLPEEAQLRILSRGNKVFCRTEPRDKQRLIRMLERLQETVGMTGDGVNDAPALKEAAIGIAMGITGTEVAKGAADMIIADDNFATIVTAIEEGRHIFATLQSFISFLLSSNIGEIICVAVSHLLGLPEILSSMHLLYVNLITDGPPAIALTCNPPHPSIMTQRPRTRNTPLVTTALLTRYLWIGAYVAWATITAYGWWFASKEIPFSVLRQYTLCPTWGSLFTHAAEAPYLPTNPCAIFTGARLLHPQSMALSVLVVMEMCKAVSCISLEQSLLTVYPWKNPWLLGTVAGVLGIHFGVMYHVPWLRALLGIVPLSVSELKMVFALSTPILLIEEVLKWFTRRSQAKEKQKQVEASSKKG